MMGCITLTLKDGEWVAVDVPCQIFIRKLKGHGKNRRRCEVHFDGETTKVTRVKISEKEPCNGTT